MTRIKKNDKRPPAKTETRAPRPIPLRVLILEDRETDAELMLAELRRAGFEPDWQRVETKEDYLAALDPALDLILADFHLPQFDGQRALRLIRERGLKTPFILVSGEVGEEIAVQMMQEGAADYVIKDRMARLGQAVIHALEDKRLRDEKLRAEEGLRESEERFRRLAENTTTAIVVFQGEKNCYVNEACEKITGYSKDELLPMRFWELIHPDFQELVRQRGLARQRGDILPTQYEVKIVCKDGSERWVDYSAGSIPWGGQPAIVGTAFDITERKQAEQELQRLYVEAQQHVHEVETLNRVGQKLTATLGQEEIIEQLGIEGGNLLRAGNFAVILRDEAKEEFEMKFYLDQGERKQGARLSLHQGLTGLIISRKEPILADDYLSECRKRGVKPPGVGAPAKAWLGVPIVAGDRTLGALLVWDYEQEGSFSTRDLQILSTLATQAAIAFENARLLESERRRLQEAETLRQASAALTSSLELKRVLDSLLNQLAQVIPYDSVTVFLRENAHLLAVAGQGLPSPEKVIGREFPEENPLLQTIWTTRHPLIVSDVQNDHRFTKWGGADYVHGWMGIPLIVRDEVIGFLTIDNRTPAAYDKSHAELALAFANQAAMAIENARLFESENIRRVEAETLREAAASLTSSLELDQVLDRLLVQLAQVVPYDSSAVFMQEGDRLRIVAGRGFAHPEKVIGGVFPADDPLTRFAYEDRRPLIIPDAQADKRFQKWGDTDQVRGWMGVPLIVRGEVIGHLTLDSFTPNAYNEGQAELALAFANQAAVAIQNARLYGELHSALAIQAKLFDASAKISSQLDLNTVLRNIAESAREAASADQTTVLLIDERGYSHHWLGTGHSHQLEPHPLRPEGISLRVMHSGQAVFIPNIDLAPEVNPRMRSEGIRSVACLPLVGKTGPSGVMWVNFFAAHVFSPAEQTTLQIFANHAAVAVEQARLFEETRQRLANLEAINRISTTLRGARTVDEMLHLVLDETLTVIGAGAGSIYLFDAARDEIRKVAAHGWYRQLPDIPRKASAGAPGQVLATGEVYLTREFAADPMPEELRPYTPVGWGGAILPIRAEQEPVGVLFVSVQLPRQLSNDDVHLLTTIAEIAGNAIRRAALHEQTERQLLRLAALHAIDIAINSMFDLHVTLDVLLGHIINQLKVDAAGVLLLNMHTKMLEFAAGRGYGEGAAARSRIRLGEGFAGRAALERELVHSPNLAEGDTERCKLLSSEGFVSYFALPLIAKGQVKGVLEICHRTPFDPDAEWLSFLETLAGQTAIAIDNATLFEGLQRSNFDLALAYDATIEGWSKALDLRDKETEGHTQRVTELTLQLAGLMGISEEEQMYLRRGALLHDIGKMGVPDSILHKPGPLSDEEWQIMHQHPVFAYEMLAPIAYLRSALDIPYCHHEKWDGTGYPRGMKGDRIPLAARIFAVVDVYDALLSDRPYRKAWPRKKVIEHIKAGSGTHFDPEAVELLLRVINENTEEH